VFDAMRHEVPSGITADDAGIIVEWGGGLHHRYDRRAA